jgi:hypothetical protein
VFHTLIIVAVLILLLLICSWLSYHQRSRIRSRRPPMTEASFDRRFYKRMTKDPEEQYVEGIGIVIGDLSCSYNARSPYIRCAINPDGLCQDCHHYHRKEE